LFFRAVFDAFFEATGGDLGGEEESHPFLPPMTMRPQVMESQTWRELSGGGMRGVKASGAPRTPHKRSLERAARLDFADIPIVRRNEELITKSPKFIFYLAFNKIRTKYGLWPLDKLPKRRGFRAISPR
jgi:hypothetical protein